MDSSNRSSVVGNTARKRNLGRFTLKACLALMVFVFLLLLLIFLLIWFLYFIPNGIRRTYQEGLQLKKLSVTQLGSYPDQKNQFPVTFQGETIHPKPFWGYQGQLHSWTFLDKEGRAVFKTQPFEETDIPNESKQKKKFVSKMLIQRMNTETASNLDILNELLSPKNVISKSNIVQSIEFKGKFGLGKAYIFQNLAFVIPARELTFENTTLPLKEQTEIEKNDINSNTIESKQPQSDSTKSNQPHSPAIKPTEPNLKIIKLNEFYLNTVKFSQVHLSLTSTGVRLEMSYSTNKFQKKFELPSGRYPVCFNGSPVLILQTMEGIYLNPNSNNEKMNVDIEFYPSFKELLFDALNMDIGTSQLDVNLQDSTKSSLVDMSSELMKESASETMLELPNFQEYFKWLLNFIKENGKYKIKKLAVSGNQVRLPVQVRLPCVLKRVDHFTADFGTEFQLIRNDVNLLKVTVSSFLMDTKDDNQFIGFQLDLAFSQNEMATNELADLHHLITNAGNSNFNFQLREINLLPIYQDVLKPSCTWCNKFFSELAPTFSLSSDFLQKWLDSSLFRNDDATSAGFLRVSHLKVSHQNNFQFLGFQAFLDFSSLGLCIDEMNIPPSTSVTLQYKAKNLVVFVLPNGFDFFSASTHQNLVSLELHFSNEPDIQPLIKEFMEIFLYQKFPEETLRFTELYFGHNEPSIQSFHSHYYEVSPSVLYTFLKEKINFEISKDSTPNVFTPSTYHLRILDGYHFFVSIGVELNAPMPLTIDFDFLSFQEKHHELMNFHHVLSEFKLKEGETLTTIETHVTTDTSAEPFHSKLIRYQLGNLQLPTPLSVTFTDLKLGSNENSQSTLDSFSQLEYTIEGLQVTPTNPMFYLEKFKPMLEEFKLLSVRPINIIINELNQYVLDFEVDYKWDDRISLDLQFISFDLYVNGGKQTQTFEIYLQKPRAQGATKSVSGQMIFEFYVGESIHVEECIVAGGDEKDISYCLLNFAIGEDASSKNSASSIPTVFSLNERSLNSIITPDFDKEIFEIFLDKNLNDENLYNFIRLLYPPSSPKWNLFKIVSASLVMNSPSIKLELNLNTPLTFDFSEFNTIATFSTYETDIAHVLLETREISKEGKRKNVNFQFVFSFFDIWSLIESKKRELTTTSDRVIFEDFLNAQWKFTVNSGREKLLQLLSQLGINSIHFESFKLVQLKKNIGKILFNEQPYSERDFFDFFIPQARPFAMFASVTKIEFEDMTGDFPVLNGILELQFNSEVASTFALRLKIESALADMLINDVPIGILKMKPDLECDDCMIAPFFTTFDSILKVEDERKQELQNLVPSLLAKKGESTLTFTNIRPILDSTIHTVTMINLFSMSVPFKSLRESFRYVQPSLQEKIPSSGGMEVPLLYIESLPINFDIENGFQVGILLKSLSWDGNQIVLDSTRISIHPIDHETPTTVDIFNEDFSLTQWKIGSVDDFPLSIPIFDAFSDVRVTKSDLINLFDSLKTISQMSWTQTQIGAQPMFQFTFKYGDEDQIFLPTFDTNIALNLDTALHISSQNNLDSNEMLLIFSLNSLDANDVLDEFQEKTSDMNSYFIPTFMLYPPISEKIEFLMRGSFLYMEKEISEVLLEQFKEFGIQRFKDQTPNQENLNSAAFERFYETENGEFNSRFQLKLPFFSNLHMDIGYVGFILEDHQTSIMIDIENLSAVSSDFFSLNFQLSVPQVGPSSEPSRDRHRFTMSFFELGTSKREISFRTTSNSLDITQKILTVVVMALETPIKQMIEYLKGTLIGIMEVHVLHVSDRDPTSFLQIETSFSPKFDPILNEPCKECYIFFEIENLSFFLPELYVEAKLFRVDSRVDVKFHGALSSIQSSDRSILIYLFENALRAYGINFESINEFRVTNLNFGVDKYIPLLYPFDGTVNNFDFESLLPGHEDIVWDAPFISVDEYDFLTISLKGKFKERQRLSMNLGSRVLATKFSVDRYNYYEVQCRNLQISDRVISGEIKIYLPPIDFSPLALGAVANLLFKDILIYETYTLRAVPTIMLETPVFTYPVFETVSIPTIFWSTNGLNLMYFKKRGYWEFRLNFLKFSLENYRWSGHYSIGPLISDKKSAVLFSLAIEGSLDPRVPVIIRNIYLGKNKAPRFPLRNLELYAYSQ